MHQTIVEINILQRSTIRKGILTDGRDLLRKCDTGQRGIALERIIGNTGNGIPTQLRRQNDLRIGSGIAGDGRGLRCIVCGIGILRLVAHKAADLLLSHIGGVSRTTLGKAGEVIQIERIPGLVISDDVGIADDDIILHRRPITVAVGRAQCQRGILIQIIEHDGYTGNTSAVPVRHAAGNETEISIRGIALRDLGFDIHRVARFRIVYFRTHAGIFRHSRRLRFLTGAFRQRGGFHLFALLCILLGLGEFRAGLHRQQRENHRDRKDHTE